MTPSPAVLLLTPLCTALCSALIACSVPPGWVAADRAGSVARPIARAVRMVVVNVGLHPEVPAPNRDSADLLIEAHP